MRIGPSIRFIPPVTLNLLIINIAVFVVMFFAPTVSHSFASKIESLFALHYFTSADFNPAQLITYMFLHGGFTHLLFNMFALYIFGSVVERLLGSKRFLFYYLSCGVGAALIQMGVFAIIISHIAQGLPDDLTVAFISNLKVGDPVPGMYFDKVQQIFLYVNTPTVGASGAIFGVLLAFGFMLPKAPLYLFFIPVPIQARWVVLGYGIIELVLGATGTADGVAHYAHLGGMIVGLIMLLCWRKHWRNNGQFYV